MGSYVDGYFTDRLRKWIDRIEDLAYDASFSNEYIKMDDDEAYKLFGFLSDLICVVSKADAIYEQTKLIIEKNINV